MHMPLNSRLITDSSCACPPAFACFKDVITVVSSSLYRGRPYRLRQLGYESNSAEHEYFLVPRAGRQTNRHDHLRSRRTEIFRSTRVVPYVGSVDG